MKKILSLLVFAGMLVGARAQEVLPSLPHEVAVPALSPQPVVAADTLALPLLNAYGRLPRLGVYPLMWGQMCNWQLHEGLNVSLGASVFTSFGRHNRLGSGFSQSAALMYASPLTNRLSLAVGGYFNTVNWSHGRFNDAGLTAVLGYRFDEHWEAYLYGQKSLAPDRRFVPLPLYEMSDIGDRIGAAVRYNVSPSFSIQVNVERRDDAPLRAFPRYNPTMP